jgi:hypothetical protein
VCCTNLKYWKFPPLPNFQNMNKISTNKELQARGLFGPHKHASWTIEMGELFAQHIHCETHTMLAAKIDEKTTHWRGNKIQRRSRDVDFFREAATCVVVRALAKRNFEKLTSHHALTPEYTITDWLVALAGVQKGIYRASQRFFQPGRPGMYIYI